MMFTLSEVKGAYPAFIWTILWLVIKGHGICMTFLNADRIGKL